LARQEYLNVQGHALLARNFYGVLRVVDDSDAGLRKFWHGTIIHGTQFLDVARRDRVTSYFGPNSGIGRAVRTLRSRGPVRMGILGLGAGVLTSYGRPGDVYRIYEINPLVEQIAQNEFTFYADSRADKLILLGDGRLLLEGQDPQQFDLLIADAFSGDAVPVHLLTREALALYFRHLKPDGVLVLNFTNRYLDLVPVAARAAQYFHKQAMVVEDLGNPAARLEPSTYALLTSDPAFFKDPSFATADITQAGAPPRFRAWTDTYSNVFQLLKWNGRPLRGTRAQPATLWEIVPGQSVGLVSLGTDLQAVVAALGPRTGRSRSSADGTIIHRWFAPPRNVGLGIHTTKTGAIDRAWILNARGYATKQGLRVGSTEAEVRAALGEPSRVTIESQGVLKSLWYDSLGIWFSVQLNRRFVFYNQVFEIGIMQRQ
jgi:hypothetical protein